MSPSCGATPLPLPRSPWPGADGRRDRFELPAVPAAVATARRTTGERMRRWGVAGDARDTALLVMSELVTNAVLHSGGERVVCRVEARTELLFIEVADEGRGPGHGRTDPVRPEDECGRGLILLDALASRWGVVAPDAAGGCTVWAEIARKD
ncbi:ATP-binding protein [Streptomyces avicenniae]|uniref:ATP-binding protein n=1 Tax=Streptomyces avicenniae TaxID=500153 RepID=UPI00069C61BA|nr:ATP-binding protein [Streptomyces avicenniae]